MTYQFQPGDRVKCVGTNDNSKPEGDGRGLVGAVYTVKSCGECSVSLRLAEIPGTVGQNRFTLHAKAGEFAVGDKVVCDAAYGEYEPFAKGSVYEIKEFRIGRHGDKYVTPDDYGTGWDAARFRLATPEEIAAAEKPAIKAWGWSFDPGQGTNYIPTKHTYTRGDTVMARVKLQDDIDEDGEFYAGYLRAEDIVSLERAAKPLAVGARVSFDSYGEKLTGTLSIIIRSTAIIDTGDDVYFKDVSEVEAAQ